MKNQRRFIRFDTEDFINIRPLNNVNIVYGATSKNIGLVGVCFYAPQRWERGELLLIDYFIIPQSALARLKTRVVWSELIDAQKGYLIGVEVLKIEENEEAFLKYYFQKVKETFLE